MDNAIAPVPRLSADTAAQSGRGPTERVRESVMEATRGLLKEVGFARLTVDGIADRSGVGKATIYRWWSNRADVAIDALLEERGAVGWFVQDRPAIENLRAQLLIATEFLRGPSGTIVAGLLGDVQHDPRIAHAFRQRFLRPLAELTHRLIAIAVDEGDLRADLDPDTLIDVLTGPIYFRLLVTGQPLSAEATERMVDTVLRGARPDGIRSGVTGLASHG